MKSLIAIVIGLAACGALLAQDELPPQRDIERATAFFKEHAPHHLEQMNRIKDEDLREWRERLHHMINRFRELQELREHEPVEYKQQLARIEAEDKLQGLAARYRNEKDPDKKKQLRKQLEEAARVVLEQARKETERELKEVAEHQDYLKKRLELMTKYPEVFIERKIAEMLDGEDLLDM